MHQTALAKHKILNDEKVSLKKTLEFSNIYF